MLGARYYLKSHQLTGFQNVESLLSYLVLRQELLSGYSSSQRTTESVQSWWYSKKIYDSLWSLVHRYGALRNRTTPCYPIKNIGAISCLDTIESTVQCYVGENDFFTVTPKMVYCSLLATTVCSRRSWCIRKRWTRKTVWKSSCLFHSQRHISVIE